MTSPDTTIPLTLPAPKPWAPADLAVFLTVTQAFGFELVHPFDPADGEVDVEVDETDDALPEEGDEDEDEDDEDPCIVDAVGITNGIITIWFDRFSGAVQVEDNSGFESELEGAPTVDSTFVTLGADPAAWYAALGILA